MMYGLVEVRLTGCPADVEKVSEYLRQSRALKEEGLDQACREEPAKVCRVLEVMVYEKQTSIAR